MNHHPGAGTTGLLQRVLRGALLALTVTLVACGGGDDGEVSNPVPVVELEVVAGGDACGGGGCGGDGSGGGGPGGSADGSAGDGAGGGLGAMRNVRVTARKPSGATLGTALLQNNLVSLYDRTYKNAFILEFADDGSGNGEYYDEATKQWTRLNGQSLHILVPRLTHHVSANPLTEAAYQWALYKYGTESALNTARMAEANEAVRQAFNARVPVAYQVSDITNYNVAVSDTTVPNSLPNTHAGRYGTLLAALPRAARLFLGSLQSPALAFMRQLVKDIRDDGIVNASIDDAEPKAYDGSLPQLLAEAILDARSDYGVAEQPAPAAVANACFNPALFTLGTQWSLEYNVREGSDTVGQTSTLDLEVTSNTATFDKYGPALEVRLVPGGVTEAATYSYFAPDLSAGLVSYGSRFAFNSDGLSLNYVSVVDPPAVNRQFLLKPGESESVNERRLDTIYNPDGTVFSGTEISGDTRVTTFIGYETVTVPAGTFKNACKYEVLDRTGTAVIWITSSGSGIEVRSDVTDAEGLVTLNVLTRGTLNGVAVQ